MKTFTTEAMDAILAGAAVVHGAIAIECDPALRAWSGYGTIALGGDDYDGVGNRAMIDTTASALGGGSQGLSIGLSAVEPEIMALFDASEVQRAPCVIWRLIMDGAERSVLDAHVFKRGRLDQITTDEEIGGTGTITAMVEDAAQGLGRAGGRMRTDTDQRLIKSADGSFKAIAYAGFKMLYWGGQPPATAGQVLGGRATTPVFQIPFF